MKNHSISRFLKKRQPFLFLALALFLALFTGCGSAASVSEPEAGGSDLVIGIDPTPLTPPDDAVGLTGYGNKGALADEDLTIADMLTYAIQDEYAAHGEYAAILAAYGNVKPYSNILRSEETHIAYLAELFTAYGMTVPKDDSSSRVVLPSSLLEAGKIGVQAEIDNIAMYKLFLSKDLPDDIARVFNALKNASESHLQAFQAQVAKGA